MSSNVKNIAIIGATGTMGTPIMNSLIARKSSAGFNITAIKRADSKSVIPSEVKVATVPAYGNNPELVSALKGQQVLIVILAHTVPQSTHLEIFEAAAAAGVPWVLPTEFGSNYTEEFVNALGMYAEKKKTRDHIEKLGVSKWIGIANNPWFNFSLPMPFAFGFDIKNKTVRFYDEGEYRIDTTSQEKSGEAVAALLASPEKGPKPSLEAYANGFVLISGLHVNQKEILAAVQKAQGSKPEEWKVSKISSGNAVEEGKKMMAGGNMAGYMLQLYALNFTPGMGGDFSGTVGNDMGLLGVAREDLDESTKKVVHAVMAS